LRGPSIGDSYDPFSKDAFPPSDFRPRPSRDTALTSFAQLGACRLGASRAFITLLDDSYQYILAEATPNIPLRANRKLEAGRALWLGNSSIPSHLGVCKLLWDSPTGYDRAIVINDLTKDPRFADSNVLAQGPAHKFYAGVPLCSPGGAVIGSYCIFGEEARDGGLSEDEIILMEDMAATVMEHMEVYRLREDQRRSEQMVKGLTGFIEGDSFIPGTNNSNFRAASKPSSVTSVNSAKAASTVKFNLVQTQQKVAADLRDNIRESQGRELANTSPISAPPEPYLSDADEDVPDDNIKGVISGTHSERAPSPAKRTASPAKRTPSPVSLAQSKANHVIETDTLPNKPTYLGVPEKEEVVPQNQEPLKKTTLQESILPAQARSMFSRAANVLRESSGLDGVVIFDASIAAFNQSRAKRSTFSATGGPGTPMNTDRQGKNASRDDDPSSSDTSSSSSTMHEDKAVCQILGFSDPQRSSTAGDEPEMKYLSLAEHSLRRMLRTYSAGRILNFNSTGEFTTSDDSDTTIKPTQDLNNTPGSNSVSKRARKEERLKSIIDAMQQVAPDATSIAFVPLWDYERSRWFACCLCWTHRPDRVLSPEVDLLYMKAFGNSIMTELARLDAKISVKAKTTFVASISHELRSPLHGILGSSEFLANTNLDPFQVGMLHSITTCGRTLLDTLDHIMDFAKINEITDHKSRSVTQLRGTNAVRISTNRMRGKNVAEMSKLSSTFDLSRVTEEVVESIFASQSYGIPYSGLNEDSSSTGFVSSTRNQLAGNKQGSKIIKERKLVLMILDIPVRPNWSFHLPAGVWRRIVMNLVGNALKYTKTGFIRISIDANKSAPKLHSKETQIVLTVRDSGIGMSTDFLANKLFSAFSQENDLSSGVGLGLHIVRQLCETVGGRIDFQSQAGVGTEVTVKFALMDGEKISDNYVSDYSMTQAKERLAGRKVCIIDTFSGNHSALNGAVPPDFGQQSFGTGPQQIVAELRNSMKGWLGMDVVVTDDWKGYDADFVVCTEPSFSHLANIRANRVEGKKVPITIFITLDAIEAAALRNDARVLSKESVVEICSQP
jgi:signal transduction histidine kinase